MMNVCFLVFCKVQSRSPGRLIEEIFSSSGCPVQPGCLPALFHFGMRAHTKADESANKGRILCFDWGHDGSFTQLLSLETAFIALDCTSVKEQIFVFAHFCTYMLCLLRGLCSSPQRCPAFAEVK